jgi:hypothetical protein
LHVLCSAFGSCFPQWLLPTRPQSGPGKSRLSLSSFSVCLTQWKVTCVRPGTMSIRLPAVSPTLRPAPGTHQEPSKYLLNEQMVNGSLERLL